MHPKKKIPLSSVMFKRHYSIGVFVVYIDTSKSRGLADKKKEVFDGMEMIRNKHIEIAT